jgi:membrane protein DedA with SNARE-associated domain
MKKIRKSTAIATALFIYITLTAMYSLPENTAISNMEKYLTVIVSYVIVLLLWLVLHKKENRQKKRHEEENYNNPKT